MAVVVFITTYALILPALTLTKDTICGLEEHTHTEDCYTRILKCGQEESEPSDYLVTRCYGGSHSSIRFDSCSYYGHSWRFHDSKVLPFI